jgi:hypothetical protein
MKKIIYPTPDGTETVYESVLTTRIDLLQARLAPLAAFFAARPAMAAILSGILPTVREEWGRADAEGRSLYLEVTPTHLSGAGFSVPYGDTDGMDPITAPIELWAFSLALAEGVRSRLSEPQRVRVRPLYVENALNMAVGCLRMTVELVAAEED